MNEKLRVGFLKKCGERSCNIRGDFEDSSPPQIPFLNMRQQTNKKDRLGNLSMTWIIRVGATGFEPAT